jgi:hypothetical protein
VRCVLPSIVYVQTINTGGQNGEGSHTCQAALVASPEGVNSTATTLLEH